MIARQTPTILITILLINALIHVQSYSITLPPYKNAIPYTYKQVGCAEMTLQFDKHEEDTKYDVFTQSVCGNSHCSRQCVCNNVLLSSDVGMNTWELGSVYTNISSTTASKYTQNAVKQTTKLTSPFHMSNNFLIAFKLVRKEAYIPSPFSCNSIAPLPPKSSLSIS